MHTWNLLAPPAATRSRTSNAGTDRVARHRRRRRLLHALAGPANAASLNRRPPKRPHGRATGTRDQVERP